MSAVAHCFEAGGWMMYGIGVVLLACVACAVERALVLVLERLRNRGVAQSVATYLRATGDVGESLRVDRLQGGGVGRIVYAGLLQAYGGIDRVQTAMAAQRAVEVARLSRRTATLKWLASLAVLFGLLGTIVGLVQPFPCVANADASSRAAALALGLSESIGCTAFGLGVAVVALSSFGLVDAQRRRAVDEIDAAVAHMLSAVVEVGPAVRVFGLRPPASPRGYRDWRSRVSVSRSGHSGSSWTTRACSTNPTLR